jgi:hypothetical protein
MAIPVEKCRRVKMQRELAQGGDTHVKMQRK